MSEEYRLARKVLNYWFTLEFLEQESFPRTQNAYGKKDRDFVPLSFYLRKDQDPMQRILFEAGRLEKKSRSNVSVYVGKLEREQLIEKLAESLGRQEEAKNRAEKNFDKVAVFAFQTDPDGVYIPYSLYLSPLVWALHRLSGSPSCSKRNLTDILSPSIYRQDVKELENKFFSKRVHDAKEALGSEESDAAERSLTGCEIKEVYKELLGEYSAAFKDIRYEDAKNPSILLSVKLFKDEKTKEEKDDKQSGVRSFDFYTEDLEKIIRLSEKDEAAIPKHLCDYITAFTSDEEKTAEQKKNRKDLLHYDTAEACLRDYREIFRTEMAPLAKWPSRFSPALMQQAAVNLARSRSSKSEIKAPGIFSVNGPPGTGKTTLLKEIVASNVTERAILLSKYEEPDAAFVKKYFSGGHYLQGDGKRSYTADIKNWYALKDDEINNFGILVASNNNAAVENISKELPRGAEILKGLKPDPAMSKKEAADLEKVSRLFDLEHASEYETYQDVDDKTWETTEEQKPDIYFSYLAEKLLWKKNAWGLIAAALGKKSNIESFYKRVLKPLMSSFSDDEGVIEARLGKYQEAREAFIDQLENVKRIREQLSLWETLPETKRKNAEELKRCQARYDKRKAELDKKLQQQQEKYERNAADKERMSQELQDQQTESENTKKKAERLTAELSGFDEELSKLNDEEERTYQSLGKKPLLFGRRRYQEQKEMRDRKLNELQQLRQHLISERAERSGSVTAVKEQAAAQEEETKKKAKALAEQYNALQSISDDIKKTRRKASCDLGQLEKSLNAIKRDINSLEEKEEYLSSEIKNNNIQMLNLDFIEELLSDDPERSSAAQTASPGSFALYDREREKLFWLALKLNKEFFLSSKACRTNIQLLSQYWGFLKHEDETVRFNQQDLEKMLPSLFQTLFLLVPVISTTFASVGQMFRDMNSAGSLGLLIVDEAGQASPQIAVGALFRCRQALIVGDPKQVEPIVKDDLKLLKESFNEAKLSELIMAKSPSVQDMADRLNPFGTYLRNTEQPGRPDWAGCPLLIHRRCISPMFEISNAVSYDNIMINKTAAAKPKLLESFIYPKSQWLNIKGKEKGAKNHFVKKQAEKVCEMLNIAFSKSPEPDVYIISPFTSVISGLRSYLETKSASEPESALPEKKTLSRWMGSHLGTVHTFQGKEANEVIFVLGCDASPEAAGAVRWVNSNIVNVAASRAKYRFYVIGDSSVWKQNPHVRLAKNIIDTFALKAIDSINKSHFSSEEEKQEALQAAASALPSASSFAVETEALSGDNGGNGDNGDNEENEKRDYAIETDDYVQGLQAQSFLTDELTQEQLAFFGFRSQEQLDEQMPAVKNNLELGIKLYFLMENVLRADPSLDASCAAILFCKAFELRMKECFAKGLKKAFPDFEIRAASQSRGIKLEKAVEDDFTLGTYQYIISRNIKNLAGQMAAADEPKCDEAWWRAFNEKFAHCRKERNNCCHEGFFNKDNLKKLIAYMFAESQAKTQAKNREETEEEIRLAGLLFEAEKGKQLEKIS